MRITRGLTMVLVACCLGWTGCGPALSPEDLGEVIFRLPELPGAEKPYELKEVPPPARHTTGDIPEH